jgi:hypothetical protein
MQLQLDYTVNCYIIFACVIMCYFCSRSMHYSQLNSVRAGEFASVSLSASVEKSIALNG